MENATLQSIDNYLTALKGLYDSNVLINRQSFTSQIGEWLVATIYDGIRAKSGIQASWDVEVNGKFIQVKTHSKAETNNSNFTAVSKSNKYHIDELIIINFTTDYKIINFYKVPWEKAQEMIGAKGKKATRDELNWSQIKEYIIPLNELPRQDIISFFINIK